MDFAFLLLHMPQVAGWLRLIPQADTQKQIIFDSGKLEVGVQQASPISIKLGATLV
jgi:hypothetical protein